VESQFGVSWFAYSLQPAELLASLGGNDQAGKNSPEGREPCQQIRLKDCFDPDLAKAQVKRVLDIAVPLLTEVVAHGLALFARCSIRPEGYDENLAILLVYRHILEMLDSVNIQVTECAPTPAALQLLRTTRIEQLLAATFNVRCGDENAARATP